MPLFACSNCNCVENTALGGFWSARMEAHERGVAHQPRCSQCNPAIGSWHGEFPKKSAAGYFVDKIGFLHTPEEVETGRAPSSVVLVGERP